MDDLLSEFLTETAESLDVVDVELVKFEQEPNNASILDNIFRLVHTVKGTCGFLGIPRLEALAHAAETLMGKYRDGAPVTPDGVSLILETIDQIKEILAELERTAAEPAGSDGELISKLDAISESGGQPAAHGEAGSADPAAAQEPANDLPPPVEREFKPGELSLDDLEKAFNETPGPEKPAKSLEASEAQASGGAIDLPDGEPTAAQDADAAKSGASSDGIVKNQSIRVNVDTLEHLMTMVSELVLTRNQLLEMVRRLDDSEFKVPLQRLSTVTAELQDGVMKTRMQPIGNAWQKLPRIIRDLSKDLDKKIDLQMNGAETELDRQILELIKDPLTHMVRNSADHGLETNEDRIKAGKPEVGVVKLSAYHEGGHIIIEIADDGRGLDIEKIKSKIIENGLSTQAELEQMTEAQIQRFIFAPGFSTVAKVTSVSGRGVGMDVVRTNIELIGGTVDVTSARGKGSTFTIKIPLTLAIVSALIVESCNQRFAIPQLSVVELVRTHENAEHRIEMINDTPVLRLRNKLLPLMKLSKLLDLTTVGESGSGQVDEDTNLFVVVIQVGAQLFGIVVDSVFDTEEIVVKPMSTMLRDISLFSGNTILGDGSVIMIIDPNGIAQTVASTASQETTESTAAEVADTEADERTAMLLFRAGTEEPKAVPLSLVTRLEEIDVSTIEHSNGQEMVQYRGTLMPLMTMNESMKRKDEGAQPILVFSDNQRSMGLMVDDIVDIVEDKLNVELATENSGMIGSAVIKGKATEIIDIGYYIEGALGSWGEQNEPGQAMRGARLLLVDDSPFFLDMLAPLLSSAGYKVTLARSAQQALAMKDSGAEFDIIVSDIEMPDMDGITFAETIRQCPKWQSTPIIALSSHNTPQIIERSREAGFVDFVGKFDRQGLIESLKECNGHMGAAA